MLGFQLFFFYYLLFILDFLKEFYTLAGSDFSLALLLFCALPAFWDASGSGLQYQHALVGSMPNIFIGAVTQRSRISLLILY